jgi:hypothetical protein
MTMIFFYHIIGIVRRQCIANIDAKVTVKYITKGELKVKAKALLINFVTSIQNKKDQK